IGPVLMTVGPWKPVSLQMYRNRIVDLDVRTQVSEAFEAKLTADITLSEKIHGFLSFVLKWPDGSVEASISRKIASDSERCRLAFDWKPGKVALWYPVGYGTQALYTVEVQLTDEVRRSP